MILRSPEPPVGATPGAATEFLGRIAVSWPSRPGLVWPVVGYLLLASLWVVGSDALVLALVPDRVELARWQTAKGLVFIAANALLLVGLLSAHGRRHRTATAVQLQTEQSFRLLFASNPLPMWVYDARTLQFLEVNEAAVATYGLSRETFLGQHLTDLHLPEEVPAYLAHLGLGPPAPPLDSNPRRPSDPALAGPGPRRSGPWRHRHAPGAVLEVELVEHALIFAGRPAVLVVAHDVTAQRQLEAQFRQAQKLEAIGRLAGGVAHDFNNVLGVILGFADLILAREPLTPATRQQLGTIRDAAERATGLIRQLLAFSRKQVLDPRVLDLNAAVIGVTPMLRRLLGEDVALVTVLDPALGRVRADPSQLEQILMNLAVNARDAMLAGGRLTIETANLDLDVAYSDRHVDLSPGPYVRLAVSDTGTGMDRATLDRLFEPFFTTKPAGQGTGLGLSTVYGIIKQSGGAIQVYSELGQGTTFKLYLPRVDAPVSRGEAASATGSPTGTETILLVEDEPALRELARASLAAAGYTVLEAGAAEAALALARAHPGPIHLLLTDVVLPGPNGRELAERLGQERPGLRVLFMSGYTDETIVRYGVLAPQSAFLQKPFTLPALAGKVRARLDHPGPSAGPQASLAGGGEARSRRTASPTA